MSFDGRAIDSTQPGDQQCVGEIIGLISPFETPLLDALNEPESAATTTEWSQTFTERVECRSDGEMQIGVDREFDYTVINKLREILRNLEMNVINGQAFDGNLHALRGIRAQVPAHTLPPVVKFHLSRAMLDDVIGSLNRKGGTPNAIVCNGWQKGKIKDFNTSSESGINDYETERGTFKIILSRWVPQDEVLLIDLNRISVVPLQGRSFHLKRRDDQTAQLTGEYTLEMRGASDGGHGVIRNLTTHN